MADLELHEIENEIVDRITAQVPGISAKAADSIDADHRWLVQSTPAVLVVCEEETMLGVPNQPLSNKCGIYNVPVRLVFFFTGMRPRGDGRVPGNELLADARDALFNYWINPGTQSPLNYLGLGGRDYDEKERKLLMTQLYETTVTREAII